MQVQNIMNLCDPVSVKLRRSSRNMTASSDLSNPEAVCPTVVTEGTKSAEASEIGESAEDQDVSFMSGEFSVDLSSDG